MLLLADAGSDPRRRSRVVGLRSVIRLKLCPPPAEEEVQKEPLVSLFMSSSLFLQQCSPPRPDPVHSTHHHFDSG